jgi:hypothetical protein
MHEGSFERVIKSKMDRKGIVFGELGVVMVGLHGYLVGERVRRRNWDLSMEWEGLTAQPLCCNYTFAIFLIRTGAMDGEEGGKHSG